jgi:MFS family permease
MVDRWGPRRVMMAGVDSILVPGAVSGGAVWFGRAVGGGLGGDYMMIPLIAAEIFGVQLLGRLMGVILTLGDSAEAASPWLIGRLRDTTGNYLVSCLVLLGMALLGAAAVLVLPERRSPA